MNKHVIQFPLFVSSKPRCQAEFYKLFVQGGLLLVRSLEEIGRKLLIFTLLMATLALIKLYVVQEYTLC